MHTVILTLACKPGVRDGLLLKLAAFLPDTRKTVGCKLFKAYTDEENPDKI